MPWSFPGYYMISSYITGGNPYHYDTYIFYDPVSLKRPNLEQKLILIYNFDTHVILIDSKCKNTMSFDIIFFSKTQSQLDPLSDNDPISSPACLSHHRLLWKLCHCSINGNIHRWISQFLCHRTQSGMVGGVRFREDSVDLGCPQGSVLGQLLFSMYILDPNIMGRLL